MENLNRDSELGAEQNAPSMDDINALLAKAGLSPIGEDASDPSPDGAADKTKHFTLQKQEVAQEPSDRTRVMPKAAPAQDAALRPAQETPQPAAGGQPKKNDSQILLDGFDDSEKPRHVDEAEEELSLIHI